VQSQDLLPHCAATPAHRMHTQPSRRCARRCNPSDARTINHNCIPQCRWSARNLHSCLGSYVGTNRRMHCHTQEPHSKCFNEVHNPSVIRDLPRSAQLAPCNNQHRAAATDTTGHGGGNDNSLAPVTAQDFCSPRNAAQSPIPQASRGTVY
jgi:hypothetical protein